MHCNIVHTLLGFSVAGIVRPHLGYSTRVVQAATSGYTPFRCCGFVGAVLSPTVSFPTVSLPTIWSRVYFVTCVFLAWTLCQPFHSWGTSSPAICRKDIPSSAMYKHIYKYKCIKIITINLRLILIYTCIMLTN